MTQVTSPDNIPSPDLTDQYALTQDMANLADGTQKALIKRANSYLGTSAQRAAFTTAPEGVHWQDTNGTKLGYVRKSGLWVPSNNLVETNGWVTIAPPTDSPGTWAQAGEPVQVRRLGSIVEWRGSWTNNTWAKQETLVKPAGTVPEWARIPQKAIRQMPVNSTISRAVWFHPNGGIGLYGSTASGAWWTFDGMTYIIA